MTLGLFPFFEMLTLTPFPVFFLCNVSFFFSWTEKSKFYLDFQNIITMRIMISFELEANKPCGWDFFFNVCVGLCFGFLGFF